MDYTVSCEADATRYDADTFSTSSMNESPAPAAVEATQNHIDVSTEDLGCKNPDDFLKHPKMLQFLVIFNRHRAMQLQGKTLYQGSPASGPPVTIEELQKSKELLQDAYNFFNDHLVLRARIKDSQILQQKVDQTFASVSEKIAAVSKAQSSLFAEFEKEGPASVPIRKAV